MVKFTGGKRLGTSRSGTSRRRMQPSLCNLKKKIGPCRAGILRYYFNKDKQICEKFMWGGCEPNKNNFEKIEDCKRICEGTFFWISLAYHRTKCE